MRVGITPPSSLFLVCSLVSDENLRRARERTAVPQVVRIERILTQRLQQKYLAELVDTAGTISRQPSDRLVGIDALRVQSCDGIDANEFLLYHGAPSEII